MKYLSFALAFALTTASAMADDSVKKLNERAVKATKVLTSIASDLEIPRAMVQAADCVAAVTIIKGGMMGLGAKSGSGLVVCKTEDGWSNPSVLNVNGANIGPQIGIGKASMVMIFVGDKSVEQLKSKNMTGDVQLSAVAGPVGREAMAGVDFKLDNGIYSYSKAKGLYLGATLGAAMMSPDKSSNSALYKDLSIDMSTILETPASSNLPDAFQDFIDELSKLEM